MATPAVISVLRSPRPVHRISRIRAPLKLRNGIELEQYVRKRFLPFAIRGGGVPRESPARLPPRIFDTRSRAQRRESDIGCNGPEAGEASTVANDAGDIENPDAAISGSTGSGESQSSQIDSFLNIKLADYTPKKSPVPSPGRKLYTDWHHASEDSKNYILDEKEYAVLKKLATAIFNATHHPGKFNKELLRRLKQAQTYHPFTIKCLNSSAWEALFAYERNTMPTILTIYTAEIMDIHGIKRTEKQECDFIGAIFWNRDRTDAMQRWVHFMRSLEKPTADTWNLGIKLLSIRREPERAMSIYNLMKESLGRDNPKILVPIILSWNHLYRHDKSWSLFLQLRRFVNEVPNCVKPSHLEDIALSFMDARKPGRAFAVWKYMWKKGFAVPEYTREAALIYQNILKSPELLHQFSTNLLDALKDRVSDKYFYASWIKNLIRLGRPDLTLQVKDIMEANGLRPDSHHVNGIIRGFLLDGYEEIAEKLAGELIQQRLRKLAAWAKAIEEKRLRKENQPFGVSLDSLPPELQNPQSPLQTIEKTLNTPPMATAGTFSVLLHHFTRRRHYEKVRFYTDLMVQCDTPINAVHMNHLINMHLRQSDLPRAEKAFDLMVNQLRCKPDQETWRLMWYAMWKRYTQPKRRYPTFQTPRQLFIKMLRHIPKFKYGDPLTEWGKLAGSPDIWRIMTRSFILARDWDGLIVALNAGDTLWRIRVDEGIYKEVIFGVLKKGKPGLICLPNGQIKRGRVARSSISRGVLELDRVRKSVSIRAKIARVTRVSSTASTLENIMAKIRKIPAEEAAVSLETVTKVLRQEAANMDSMVGIQRLRDVREEMGLSHIGIRSILPPAQPAFRAKPMSRQQAWVSNLY